MINNKIITYVISDVTKLVSYYKINTNVSNDNILYKRKYKLRKLFQPKTLFNTGETLLKTLGSQVHFN